MQQNDDVIDVEARPASGAQQASGHNTSTPPLVDYVAKANQLKAVGWVSYLLHLLVAVTAVIPGMQAMPLVLLISVIIDLVKRDDAQDTWQQSHFAWRLRSVFGAMVLYVVTLPLYLLLWIPGVIAWFLISLWFLYRIVLGIVCMHKNQPMYPPVMF